MKNKKLIALISALAIIISAVSLSFAAYGSDIEWSYDSNSKTLFIKGSGDMDDFADPYSSPWHIYILSVENVVIGEGITSIGNYAFAGAEKLNNADIADTVTKIGSYSFSSCSSLSSLELGNNVVSIADSSFAFDGVNEKENFIMRVYPGSYALYYAVKNSIAFDVGSVVCDTYSVKINPKGMRAYYPYTAKVSGTFKFYSSGKYDTVGYLYNSSMEQIAYDDDSGSSTNFSITAELQKGETYYIRANIWDSSISGSFDLTIEPVSYSVQGTIFAMKDKTGTPSDIVLNDVLIDGEASNGSFSYTITESKTITITAGYATAQYTFSPDNGEDISIPVMMCDVNSDGIVNAKDYAIMKKSSSEYLPLFANFVNYRTE